MRGGNILQHFATLAARRGEIIVTERRVGDYRCAVLLAPRNHRMLDRALLQMIEHLIAGDLALAGNLEHLVEIVGVEIADAPETDLSLADQLLERDNRFG